MKRWGFSLEEALKDPVGRDQFLRFLESEFSSENLRYGLHVFSFKAFDLCFGFSCRKLNICLNVANSPMQ